MRAICRRAFGTGARIAGVGTLAGGSVNATYRLDVEGEPACVLRVAPSLASAAAGPSWLSATTLRQEHALTPFLAPLAPLLPRTVAADFTRHLVDRDWTIQTVVPGEPWDRVEERLTPLERADLWRQLGSVARAIHAVEEDAFGPPGRPAERWSDVVRGDIRGLAEDWRRFAIERPELIERLGATVERNRATLDAVTVPRLVHGDLYPRHVFVARDTGAEWRISGLIDHEYGRFADPASESLFEVLACQSPPVPSEAAAFFEAYGPLPDDAASRWRSLVYRAVILGWEATASAFRGDVQALEDALVSLPAVVEEVSG